MRLRGWRAPLTVSVCDGLEGGVTVDHSMDPGFSSERDGSCWRLLSRGVTRSDLGSTRITLDPCPHVQSEAGSFISLAGWDPLDLVH